MAYESPITILERVERSVTEELEDTIARTVSLHYGVTVNKEELKKALLYDRGQYDKGYEDALAEVRERVEMAYAEIHEAIDCCPITLSKEMADKVMKNAVSQIFNKYLRHLGEVEHENEK